MIKNILSSKLFVLCSMLFCSLVVSVFCFGISSKAADQVLTHDELNKKIADIYGLDSFSWGSNWEAFLNFWAQNDDYSVMFDRNTNNGIVVAEIGASNIFSETESNYVIAGRVSAEYASNGNTYGATFISRSYDKTYPIYYVDYESFVSGNIDWDNPFYSANIVAPNMNVTYRELSSTPVIDVPLNIQVSSYPNNENEYYVQLFGLINYDENYYVQNTRDGIVYNGMDLQKFTTYVDIVTPKELLKPSDLSFDMLHLKFTNGWYNNYPSDNLFSFTFQEGIPSPLQTTAINKFNSFRKNATFADNTVYVYARYFVIDQDNNFVVGPWGIWKSYNPNEFTTEVPSYYLPYGLVPGTYGTNNSVTPVSASSPDPSVIDNPVQTNPSVNITVTQNVPNYPDYPTIASYNKDNLLVDTMNQLTSIQGFFGEFGSFLVTAFAFMPAWIWAIIGVGFSLSIVVMFLKIL